MHNLLSWMENEVTARLRSGATLLKAGASPRSTVHLIGFNDPVEEREQVSGVAEGLHDRRGKQMSCYVCKSNHYVDLSSRFLAMTPGERWKIVKEQRGCFSYLKRGKGHTSSNCL